MKLIITTIFLATSSLFAQMSLNKPGNVGIETPEENQYIGKLSNYSKIIYHQVKTESDIRTVVDSKKPWSKTFLNIKGEWHIQFLAKAKPTFETVCKQKNIHIGMRLDSIFSGYVAYQKLDELLQIPSLEYLEFGIPVKPAMAAARSETGVDDVHQGGSSYGASKKGEGVIIGIVDAGFDYTHPNFLDSAGNNCRISHVWEQNTSGSSNVRWGYGYGKEYKTSSSIKNRQHDQNLGSHATHVMGIAGGSGDVTSGQKYLGVAPKSELIAVSTNFSHIGILEGIEYVFNIADSLDKPAVANLSIGSHVGPHDGTSAFDISLKSLVKKSRIVVGAAGNEGEDSLHLQHTFSTSDSILYAFVQLNGGNTRPGGKSVLDIWGENKKDFRVAINLVNLSTNKFEDFTPYYRASSTNSNINRMLFDTDNVPDTVKIFGSTGINSLNKKPNATFYIDHNQYHETQWVMLEIIATSGTVHAWLNSGIFPSISGANTGIFHYRDRNLTVGEIGGTAPNIVTVGAYSTTNSYTNLYSNQQNIPAYTAVGEIAPFSSMGPTVDKRTKPDIAAPGNVILSSVNSFDTDYTTSTPEVVGGITNGTQTWLYAAMEGTSMATPFTTGVVALMLEMYPDMTFNMVKRELQSNAKTDSYTGTIGSSGSNIWGAGKINAAKIISNMYDDIPKKPVLSNKKDTIYACPGEKVKLFVVSKPSNITNTIWSNAATTDTITLTTNKRLRVRYRSNQGYDGPYSDYVTIIFKDKPFTQFKFTKTPAFCEGDSTILKSDSIASNYTYRWYKNGAIITGQTNSELVVKTTGTYSLNITTTEGCIDSSMKQSVLVQSYPVVSFQGSIPKELCEGDSYEATIINPTNDVNSYNWYINGTQHSNTGSTLTLNGNSTIFVLGATSIGCEGSTDTVKIDEVKVPLMLINNNSNESICEGDSLVLEAIGTADAYEWLKDGSPMGESTNRIAVNQIGTYAVKGSNKNLCHDTSNSTTLSLNPLPTAELSITGDTTFCEGGSVTLELNSDKGEFYYLVTDGQMGSRELTSDFTVNSSGVYNISTKENTNGCTNTSRSVNVTVLEQVNTPNIQGNNLVNTGETYTYNVPNNAGSQYTWKTTDGVVQSGQGTATVDVIWDNVENASIEVIESNGYCADTSNLAIQTTLHVADLDDHQVLLFPNPSDGNELTIQSNTEIIQLEVTDMSGKKVNAQFKNISTKKVKLSSELNPGNYLLRVQTKNGSRGVLHFVIH